VRPPALPLSIPMERDQGEGFGGTGESAIFPPFARTTPYLTHPVFNRYHSETEMLRYIHRLESRDLSLTTSMIPLGSCTMKLNATAEMYPITWPEFGRIHPFVPVAQTQGYQTLFRQLEEWLADLTGFAAVSLQPNAGSQGDVRRTPRHQSIPRNPRTRPSEGCVSSYSAHGTNPASASMAACRWWPWLR